MYRDHLRRVSYCSRLLLMLFSYTYELCFFGQARQKSNKDSSSNHLGTFSDWTGGGETGSFDYYTKQSYSGG